MTQEFRQMQAGEECLPVMDDYAMKCCDCGLVHLVKFRAVRVLRTMEDGTFEYEVLDPETYRVELSMQRVDEP